MQWARSADLKIMKGLVEEHATHGSSRWLLNTPGAPNWPAFLDGWMPASELPIRAGVLGAVGAAGLAIISLAAYLAWRYFRAAGATEPPGVATFPLSISHGEQVAVSLAAPGSRRKGKLLQHKGHVALHAEGSGLSSSSQTIPSLIPALHEHPSMYSPREGIGRFSRLHSSSMNGSDNGSFRSRHSIDGASGMHSPDGARSGRSSVELGGRSAMQRSLLFGFSSGRAGSPPKSRRRTTSDARQRRPPSADGCRGGGTATVFEHAPALSKPQRRSLRNIFAFTEPQLEAPASGELWPEFSAGSHTTGQPSMTSLVAGASTTHGSSSYLAAQHDTQHTDTGSALGLPATHQHNQQQGTYLRGSHTMPESSPPSQHESHGLGAGQQHTPATVTGSDATAAPLDDSCMLADAEVQAIEMAALAAWQQKAIYSRQGSRSRPPSNSSIGAYGAGPGGLERPGSRSLRTFSALLGGEADAHLEMGLREAVAAATFRNVEGPLAGGRSSSFGPDSPTGVTAHIWRIGGESACSSVCGAAASHNTSFTGSISAHKDNILDWLQAPEESLHVYGHAIDKRSGSKTVRKTPSALHLTAVLEELPQPAKGPGEQTCSQLDNNYDSVAAQHAGTGSAVRLQPNLKRVSPRWGATDGNEDFTPATTTSAHSATGPGAATGSSPHPLSSGRSQTRLSPHLSAGPQATSPRGSVNGHGRMSYLAPPGKAALQQRLNMALNLSGRYSS